MSQHLTYQGTITNFDGLNPTSYIPTSSSFASDITPLDAASTVSTGVTSATADVERSYATRVRKHAPRSVSLSSSTPSTTVIALFPGVDFALSASTLNIISNSDTATSFMTIKIEFNEMSQASYATTIAILPMFIIDTSTYTASKTVDLTLTSHTTSSKISKPSNTGDVYTATPTSTNMSRSTSANTSTANSTDNPPSVPKTHSSGTTIGAIVGCLITGLLVAFAVGFWFLRRRKRSKNRQYAANKEVGNSKFNRESFKLAKGSRANIEKHLPQPESDQTIARLANRTLDGIELFVETYYTDRSVIQAGRVVTTDMSAFDSPHLDRPLANLLQSHNSATALLKHCIAYHCMQKIEFTCNESSSLLPMTFVVPSEGDRRTLSQARVRTVHSQPDIEQDETYLAKREQMARATFHQMERAFQPWAQGTAQDRAKTFRGIVTHLSELGRVLFSQPATFKWRWVENHSTSRDRLVMLPGLDKMTDSQAVPLTKPICLIEPRMSSVS